MAAKTLDDDKIFSKYFKVEIQGIYGEVPGVVDFDAGRVTFTIEETTQGDQPEYRTYTYGSHEYEDLTLTVQQAPGETKIQDWVDKATKMGGAGSSLRRDITASLLARDKSKVLKTINCFGCFPLSFDAGGQSTSSEIKTLTLTCNVNYIEVM
jgi:hypothetical protein